MKSLASEIAPLIHRLPLGGIFPDSLEVTEPQSVRDAIAEIRPKIAALLSS